MIFDSMIVQITILLKILENEVAVRFIVFTDSKYTNAHDL